MKKNFIVLLVATTVTTSMFSLPITAKANELTRYNSNIELQRGKADWVKKWSVIDENGVKHDLSMDYKNMIMTIDNEEIEIIEEKIALSLMIYKEN